jgi:multiple sugar transport system permease protein
MFLMTIVPFLYLLVTSFTPLNLTMPHTAWQLDDPLVNYRILAEDERFRQSVWVQAKLSTVTVLSQLLIGLLLALLLNVPSSFVAGFRTVFLVPMVLPPIVVAIIFKVLYTPDISPVHQLFAWLGRPFPALITHADWALTAIMIADTWQWFPFTMLMLLAALQMMPSDPVEAARIDGAGAWQVTRHMTLPWLRPVLLVAGLFRLVDSIKAFPLIYVLTDGGPGNVTEVTNFYAFRQAFNFSYLGFASAISMVMLAATFGLSWWIMRKVGLGVDVE